MKSKQFVPVPIKCPKCGHIIGYQAFFQSFEQKVAIWLNGKTAPNSQPGYDVHQCKPFPKLTFQVKYASLYKFKSPKRAYTDEMWTWVVKYPQPKEPDFFVLFGLRDQKEFVFLVPRDVFFSKATTYKERISLKVSAKEKSDRKNYNYIPWIWEYWIKNPKKNLASAPILV